MGTLESPINRERTTLPSENTIKISLRIDPKVWRTVDEIIRLPENEQFRTPSDFVRWCIELGVVRAAENTRNERMIRAAKVVGAKRKLEFEDDQNRLEMELRARGVNPDEL